LPGLNILAQLKAACNGDLSKVKRIVKLVGFVHSDAEFYEQPAVINGASDLMTEVARRVLHNLLVLAFGKILFY
jgi:enamine deaminase RidA (YjgF/YER057c/UK114 family)